MRRARASVLVGVALACAAAAVGITVGPAAAAEASGRAAASSGSGAPHHGGTLTVLENSAGIGDWPTLDPATDTNASAEDDAYFEAIYGDLFELNGQGKILPDLATGYHISDGGKTVAIFIRQGVRFQDGTPFNAAAVASSIQRDLDPKYACACDPFFPVASVTTSGNYTVVLNLSRPFPVIAAFPEEAPNWVVSPTALAKMGEQAFSFKPVGAGPFEVVSNTPNAELVMKKYSGYWQAGHPYLNTLIFKVDGSDQSALDALETHEADVAQQVGTYQVIQEAEKQPGVRVVTSPGAGTFGIQLNVRVPPFNNILAREAVYYATDPEALNRALIGGTGAVAESGNGPASPFYEKTVPGYRTYNLSKAKAIVKQLGGLSFTMGSFGPNPNLYEALQSEWQAAGMHVTLQPINSLPALVEDFFTKKWQALLGGCGGVDPAIGAGSLTWRCLSTGPFDGLTDTHLDAMINLAASLSSTPARAAEYKKIYLYISQHAYLPFLYSMPAYNIATTSTHGLGLTTASSQGVEETPFWPDVWVSSR
jgi:peptide/nickel transport system substrate-binding protein